jgi:hypothetical protein
MRPILIRSDAAGRYRGHRWDPDIATPMPTFLIESFGTERGESALHLEEGGEGEPIRRDCQRTTERSGLASDTGRLLSEVQGREASYCVSCSHP